MPLAPVTVCGSKPREELAGRVRGDWVDTLPYGMEHGKSGALGKSQLARSVLSPWQQHLKDMPVAFSSHRQHQPAQASNDSLPVSVSFPPEQLQE